MQLPFKVFLISGVLLAISVVASAQPGPHHRPVHRKHRVHHVHHVHHVAHRRAHHPLPPHR